MPAPLLAAIFWVAVVAVVVSQAMILRSTARVLRAAVPQRPLVEWGFAVGPALVLVAVLYFSWQAAMRPATIEVEVTPLPGEIRL